MSAARQELSGNVRNSPGELESRKKAWSARLASAGPGCASLLSSALAEEEDGVVAEAIELALLESREGASADPLLRALERRGLGANGALVRSVGALGGERGTRLLLGLLDELDREWAKVERAVRGPERISRIRQLAEVRFALIEALGLGADPAGLERLFAMLGKLEPTEYGSAVRASVRASIRCALERTPDQGEEAERAAGVVSRALGELRGEALAEMLDEIDDRRSPGLLAAIGRILDRTSALRALSPEPATERRAAVAALRVFVVGGQRPPDPAAIALVTGLLDDPDEAIRLVAASDLGASGEVSSIPRLIDALERDPSAAVRSEARTALVKLGGGVDRGDARAWREWWNAGRPRG